MKHQKKIIAVMIMAMLGFSTVAAAEKGNWKKGRIYFRMVCSDCHEREAGGKISPNEKTRARIKKLMLRCLLLSSLFGSSERKNAKVTPQMSVIKNLDGIPMTSDPNLVKQIRITGIIRKRLARTQRNLPVLRLKFTNKRFVFRRNLSLDMAK